MSLTLSRRSLFAGGAAALAAPTLVSLAGPARAQTSGATWTYPRRLGSIEITAVLDGHIPLDPGIFVNVDGASVKDALEAGFLEPGAPVATGITAHLLRVGDRTVLIDTGASAEFGPTVNRLAAGLTGIGVAPTEIDLLLITHMHPDHIGGMMTEGSPAFPNAEVRIAQADLDFWTDQATADQAPSEAQPFFTLARAVATAYASQIAPFTGEVEVGPGITALPLPGHTPGHTGFWIESDGARLFHWADVVHVAAVQFPHPQASATFDIDPAQAAATRAAAFDRAAAERVLIAGAHLPYPAFGHVARGCEGYAWVPEAWQYS